MKALGSFVTFVRRNLSAVVTLRYTCATIKLWSRMFALNVQSVSIWNLDWNVISLYTRTSKALAAFYVTKVSDIKATLWCTLTDVLLRWVSVICCPYVSITHNSLCLVCHYMYLLFIRSAGWANSITSQKISVCQPVCESAWLCVCVLTRVAQS